MKAILKTYMEIGEMDISVSLYSAVDSETSLKQISKCCNSGVNYLKVCGSCKKNLSADEIYKALEVRKGNFKAVDSEKLKLESGNLKFLGIVADDSESKGYLRDEFRVIITPNLEGKNVDRDTREEMKFAYMREALNKGIGDGILKAFLGIVINRNKEHLVLIKPFGDSLIALGLVPFDRVRETPYKSNVVIDSAIVDKMVEKFKDKPIADIESYKDKKAELIAYAMVDNVADIQAKEKEKKELNAEQLLNF